jgi:hypothetical protein
LFATKQAAQSVTGPAFTLSDKKLPIRSNTKNLKKMSTAAPWVALVASACCSTYSYVVFSALGSGKKHASAKDCNNKSEVTHPEH